MQTTIPHGSATVEVSIISPNQVLDVPPNDFLSPEIPGTTYSDTPCLAFLIEHCAADGKLSKALFDLGVRSDWENLPPGAVAAIKTMDIKIHTKADVVSQLEAHDIDTSTIDTLFFSHWHFDHVGDATRLPTTCKIVMGPGAKEFCLPGYPEDPDSLIHGDVFQDREFRELDFSDTGLNIADLTAMDWFGDGSLYLLNTPGHAVGHISALARTTLGDPAAGTNDTFLLLAGDVYHHMGELIPNDFEHLPEVVPLPSGLSASSSKYLGVHPCHSTNEPFYKPSAGGSILHAAEMQATVRKAAVLDSDPSVFTILSPDYWLLDVINLFSGTANEWQAKGWAEEARCDDCGSSHEHDTNIICF